jgi:hypothetical protein
LRYYGGICLERLKKAVKNSAPKVEMRNRQLPNAFQTLTTS